MTGCCVYFSILFDEKMLWAAFCPVVSEVGVKCESSKLLLLIYVNNNYGNNNNNNGNNNNNTFCNNNRKQKNENFLE